MREGSIKPKLEKRKTKPRKESNLIAYNPLVE